MGLENLPKIDLEEEAARAKAKRGVEIRTKDGVKRAAHARTDVVIPRKRSLRRKLGIAAVCAVVLVGGGATVAAAMGLLPIKAHTEPEIQQMEPAPLMVPAMVKADNVLIPGPALTRGSQLINVVEADELSGQHAGKYYRAVANGKTVYVEKRYVRLASEAAPEQWTGYAAEDAIIYKKPDFSGTDILTLHPNEEVLVVDEFENLLFVRNADGFEGYMPADKVLKEKAPEEEEGADDSTASGGSQGSSGSGSSGGSSSGGYYNGGSTGGSGSSSGSSGGSTGGSGSGGSSSSGSGGSTGGDSGSGSGSSGTGGSAGESGGSGSGSADGDEITMPSAFTLRPDPFLLGVRVAYADEPKGEEVTTLSSEQPSAGNEGAIGDDAANGDEPVSNTADEGESATVLIDGVKSYIGILNRGDIVQVKMPQMDAADNGEGAEGDAPVSSEGELNDVAETGAEDDGKGDIESSAESPVADSDERADENLAGPQGSSDEKEAVSSKEAMCTVVINDQETQLPIALLRLEGEAPYKSWTGYAAEGIALYADYQLQESVELEVQEDTEIQVIDLIGKVLVVSMGDKTLYAEASAVSREPIADKDAATDEDDEADSDESSEPNSSQSGSQGSSNAGYSGGSSSGSSGGSNYGSGGTSGSAGNAGSSSGSSGSGNSGSGSNSGSSSGGNTGSSGGGSGSSDGAGSSGTAGSGGNGSGSGSSQGGSGESGSGSGSGSGSSSDEDQWTAPKL